MRGSAQAAPAQKSRPGRRSSVEQSKIRVCLMEGDAAFREKLEGWIRATANLVLAGSFADASSGLDALSELRPDVIVLDYTLSVSGLSGDAGIRRIREQFRNSRILVLTQVAEDDVILDCLRNGADGFWEKSTLDRQTLCQVVRDTAEGNVPLSRRARALFVHSLRKHLPVPEVWNKLSQRERQVAEALKERLSDQEIADRLELSLATVKTHLKHIFEKTGYHGRVEAVKAIWPTIWT